MLGNNVALTHLDVSHNRINLEGALSLAEGIRNNNALVSLELGFNPMGMQSANPVGVQGLQQNLSGEPHRLPRTSMHVLCACAGA